MELRRHRAELISRLNVLSRLAQVLVVLIAAGYWSVQVANGAYYRELADHNRLRKRAIDASRGLIFDRHGQPLVENVPSYSLMLDRSRAQDLDRSLELVVSILGTPDQELRKILESHRSTPRFRPITLAEDLSLAELARFEVQRLEYPEFEVATNQLRLYRYAHQTSHILGYLGEVGERELQIAATDPRASYKPGDLVGKKGIELQHERLLRGADGEQVVVVDSRGQTIEKYQDTDRRRDAEAGRNLTLSLDLNLQQQAARLLEGKVGSIVAMDPRTGEILAMASSPAFNPNLFARRIQKEEWRRLIEDPYHPLQNRALQNTYPPGSVFKIVMAVAALEESAIDPSHKVFCRGFSMINDHRYRCWKSAGHGWVNLNDAIKYSCNVYFHQLGQKLDVDTIAHYSRLFGLGSKSGIDLAGEKAGLVPDRAWSRRARGTKWFPGETISVATGQGPLLVTPLQVAVMASVVAMNGRLVTPTFLSRPTSGKLKDLGISPRSLQLTREAMWTVVNDEGTGRSASIDGFEIAGKTGTAQVVRQETWTKNEDLAAEKRDHAWFASFGPFDDPKLTVVVFIEHGGAGSEAAAPLAKAMYEEFVGNLQPHHPG